MFVDNDYDYDFAWSGDCRSSEPDIKLSDGQVKGITKIYTFPVVVSCTPACNGELRLYVSRFGWSALLVVTQDHINKVYYLQDEGVSNIYWEDVGLVKGDLDRIPWGYYPGPEEALQYALKAGRILRLGNTGRHR